MDDAAVAFVRIARGYGAAATKEYCAWIIRGPDGRHFWGAVNEGDMNRCSMNWPRPDGTVASVHTHPTSAGGGDIEAAGQVFSEGDFYGSEWKGEDGRQKPLPGYLGAPAGHVLRYDPGGTTCKGATLIKRDFVVVSGSVDTERLAIKPGKFMPLFDQAGRPVPAPAYCKRLY